MLPRSFVQSSVCASILSCVARLDDPVIRCCKDVGVGFVDAANQEALRAYLRAGRRHRMALIVARTDETPTKVPSSRLVLDAPMGVDAIREYLEEQRGE